MKIAKTGEKLLAGCLLSFLLMLTANSQVLAAQEDKLFVIGAMDETNELIGFGTAAVIYENEDYFVLVHKSVINDHAAAYVLLNLSDRETTYDLGQPNTVFEDVGIARFEFKDDLPPRSMCVEGEQAVNGMIVNVVYITTDLEPASFQMRLTGAEERGDFVYLDGCVVDSSGNETEIPSDLESCFPLPMINDDGNLVALMLESGEIVSSMKLDVAEFQAGAEPDSGDFGQTEPEQDDDGRKPDSGERKGGSEEEDTKISVQLPAVLAGIGILTAIVVFVVWVKLSSKKGKSMPQGAASVKPQPVQQVDIQPVQPQLDVYSPTGPYTGPPPVQPVFDQAGWYIVGVAGVMQGRSYPVGKEGLSIGRISSSNIRFSDDVKGISRQHCRILTDGQKLLLMDCNSTYGTFLKGYGKLPAQKPVSIKRGDLFYLGSEQQGFAVQ